MKRNEYKEDLEYPYSALLNHPSIIVSEKERAEVKMLLEWSE